MEIRQYHLPVSLYTYNKFLTFTSRKHLSNINQILTNGFDKQKKKKKKKNMNNLIYIAGNFSNSL